MRRALWIGAAAALALPLTAAARHPERAELERVRILAHQLEDAARHVHRAAEDRRHHLTYREEAGLRRLHDLEDQSRHFHRQIERYRRDPWHTEDDFEALWVAFLRAQEAMHSIHPDRHIDRDFRRVEVLMDELLFFYDDGSYHGRTDGRYRSHRRALPRFHFSWRWWR